MDLRTATLRVTAVHATTKRMEVREARATPSPRGVVISNVGENRETHARSGAAGGRSADTEDG